jgi:hypothetical protein
MMRNASDTLGPLMWVDARVVCTVRGSRQASFSTQGWLHLESSNLATVHSSGTDKALGEANGRAKALGPAKNPPLVRKCPPSSRSQDGPGTPPGPSFVKAMLCGRKGPLDLLSGSLLAPGKRNRGRGFAAYPPHPRRFNDLEKQAPDAGTQPVEMPERPFLKTDEINKHNGRTSCTEAGYAKYS